MVTNELRPVTEKQIVTPLELVLNEVTPKTKHEKYEHTNNSPAIKKSLEELFPEQQYEKKVQKAKEILGPLANKLSTSELRDVIAETEFLVGSWLDDFERQIFEGKTLNELLHEKGAL